MSLSNIAHLCSHLNNVNKARLALASVPNTKLHLKLCLAFLNQGVVSSVVRGGKSAPPPHILLGHPTLNDDKTVDIPSTEPVTQSNVASRRLWLGLKYWQNEPVMGKLAPVSKPKRKITLDIPGIRRVHRGVRSDLVEGLRSPGELLFMLTDRGLLESRQCLERNVGGMVLCRMK
jgi:ribosomal protein S8